jgi:hypothetical protein
MLDVITDLAERKRATIFRLVANGETLAVQLVFNTDTAAFISISGFRMDAWDFSPTNYLQWAAVMDAVERGRVEVNFSSSPTQAKMRWSRKVRVYPEFLLIGPTRFARLVAAPLFLVATALSGYGRELHVWRFGQLVRRIGRSG